MSDQNITPREHAYDVALMALYQRYQYLPERTVRDKQFKNSVANLYNRLLAQSGMEGLPLENVK